MLLFINTRPTHRAQPLSLLACASVRALPLLTIDDLPINSLDEQRLAAFAKGDYQLLVVTSVESARRAMAFFKAHQLSLPATPIVAVGSATAEVLRAHGLSVILPKTANNEGMLALPIVESLRADQRVMIWRGIGGRRLLHDTLTARGVQIDAIEWYERRAPADLTAQFTKIASDIDAADAVFVLISSQMAFEHWLKLPHTRTYHYLALGNRLADIIYAHADYAAVQIIDDLSADAIGAAIAQSTKG